MHSDLFLMLLSDARLPVAGHTQSAGLEPALRDGFEAGDVPGYIRVRLDTVTRVEAGVAVVARHRFLCDEAVGEVEPAWAARTPSAAMRATSRTQGRAYLRLVRRVWPASAFWPLVAVRPDPCRPLVLAAVAAECGLSGVELARIVGYDDVQTVASAALKLLPLDPVAVACWVHDALTDVEAMAHDIKDLTEPWQIPAVNAPQIEQWAEAHSRESRRLFSA